MKIPNQLAFNSIPNDMAGVRFQSKAKQEMVEIGGRLAQILGLPRSTGQVFGLLFFSSEPLSLGEMCKMLGISKASTSTATRQLATWGAIQKVWIPGQRKDYYKSIEDLSEIFKGSYRNLIKPRMSSSKNRLELLEESLSNDLKMNYIKKEEQQFMALRLGKIKKLHTAITNSLPILEKLV
jgi:DNA-binding transcriptional regulator GbsR (MarR family)